MGLCTLFDELKQNRLVKCCIFEPSGLYATKYFEEGVKTFAIDIHKHIHINVYAYFNQVVYLNGEGKGYTVLQQRKSQA